MSHKLTVLGAGPFGTAMATLLAGNGHEVKLWCYEKDVAQEINDSHENKRYLPGIKLDSKITATTDLAFGVQKSIFIFEAIPIPFFRGILKQVKDLISPDQIIVLLSKGLEQNTLFLPSQIVDDVFDKQREKAVVAGPNFAMEIAKKYPTPSMICSDNKDVIDELKKILQNDFFRCFSSKDVIGVQIGGALKNLIAVSYGMFSEHLKDQTNFLAFVLTQGLEEMSKVSASLGGKPETVYSLAGFGDLVLTTTGLLSRNLKAGKMLAKGLTLEEISASLQTLPEGISTAHSIYELIEKFSLKLPLCKGTCEVIYKKKSLDDFSKELMRGS